MTLCHCMISIEETKKNKLKMIKFDEQQLKNGAKMTKHEELWTQRNEAEKGAKSSKPLE